MEKQRPWAAQAEFIKANEYQQDKHEEEVIPKGSHSRTFFFFFFLHLHLVFLYTKRTHKLHAHISLPRVNGAQGLSLSHLL